MKWIGLLAVALLVASCFIPWVVIESRNITISGIDAEGTNYGKPGYFHLLLAAIFLVFHLTPRLWAKRGNLVVAGLNTGWALRNFFLIATCQMGDCPARKGGLYLMLLGSLLLLAATLFPDMKMPQERKEK